MFNSDSSSSIDEPHFEKIVTTAVIECSSDREQIRRSSRNTLKRASKRKIIDHNDFDKIEIVKTYEKSSKIKKVSAPNLENADLWLSSTRRHASFKASEKIRNIMKPSKPVEKKAINRLPTENDFPMNEKPQEMAKDNWRGDAFDILVQSVKEEMSPRKIKKTPLEEKCPKINIIKADSSSRTLSPLPDLEIVTEYRTRYMIDTLSDSDSPEIVDSNFQTNLSQKEMSLGITQLSSCNSITKKSTSIDSRTTVAQFNNLEYNPPTPPQTDFSKLTTQCNFSSLDSCETQQVQQIDAAFEKEDIQSTFEKSVFESSSYNQNDPKPSQCNFKKTIASLYNIAFAQIIMVHDLSETMGVKSFKKFNDTKLVQNVSHQTYGIETPEKSFENCVDVLISSSLSNFSKVDDGEKQVHNRDQMGVLSEDLKKELLVVESHLRATMEIIGTCLDKIQGPIEQPYIKLYNLLTDLDQRLANHFSKILE